MLLTVLLTALFSPLPAAAGHGDPLPKDPATAPVPDAFAPASDAPAPALIPNPALVERLAGAFTLPATSGVTIEGVESGRAGLTWLLKRIAADTQTAMPVRDGEGGAIRLSIVGEEQMPPEARGARAGEAYELRVDATGVRIRAAAPAGLYYGLATLSQLLAGGRSIAALRIVDRPRFPWRGLMLDSARHMQSVAYIKRYIDWLSLHKMNVFHWHLTDDQGWRLDIEAWPKLTEVGAWRVPAGSAAAADIDETTGAPRRYGGYYRQHEIREIVAHAADRFVTIVPEVDVPGHAVAAIAAYPELGVEGFGVAAPSSSWGIHEQVFNLEEATFGFLESVLDEMLRLFPGEYYHLGGDEVVKTQWQSSPRVAERMRALGLRELDDVQNYFVERLQTYLAPHGKKVIGWDEIVASDLPADTAVMSWRGVAGALEAAAKGHHTVLSPAPTLYLDHLQSDAADAPPGRGSVIRIEDIYRFDPLPGNLRDHTHDNAGYVLGVQANLWTEHVRTEQRATYMTWPRALAVAELGWSPAARRAWDHFAARLAAYLPALKRLIPNAADEPFAARIEARPGGRAPITTAPITAAKVTLSSQAGIGELRYTLDGAVPGPASRRYEGAFETSLPVTVRAAVFHNGRALTGAARRDLSAQSLLRREDRELELCGEGLVLALEDDGPIDGERASFLVDILNPCYRMRDVAVAPGASIAASVGQLPFNFEIGEAIDGIRHKAPTTAHGELNVYLGDCDGPLLASLPLAAAARRHGTTELAPAPLRLPAAAATAAKGTTDLCFDFAQRGIDPFWVIDWVRLLAPDAAPALSRAAPSSPAGTPP